jgi:hypothetical protein
LQLIQNKDNSFGISFALPTGVPEGFAVIIYALLAAVLILVAVSFISSIATSSRRRS